MADAVGAGASRHQRDGCPKRMEFGPCGGVRTGGRCEIDDRPCPFVDQPVLEAPAAARHVPRAVALDRCIVDLRVPADDDTLASVADVLRPARVTALVGEHVDDPPATTPSGCAERLASVGLPAIVTLTGRRRSVDAHRSEIGRLAALDVVAVHCVTGDHPAARFGPDATAAFSLDGTRLAAAARAAGATVSVSESPASPPVERRPERVVMKEAAGADLVVLNHAGSPARSIAFADRCAEAGARLAMVAPVPVITDRVSARALDQFPGLELPDGLVDRVLAAPDPLVAGVEAAAEIGSELLASGRFAAVNLSGSARSSGALPRAETMAAVAAAIG